MHLTHRQRGFAMMEVSLALIITAFAALGTIKANLQAQHLEFAAIQGDGLRIARDAGETYAQENYTALQSGGAVTKNGYTVNPGTSDGQTYRPTVTDLIGLGYLQTGFSVQGSFSNGQPPGSYRFTLQRTPAGCELIAAGASCDIKGFAYLDQPIRAAGSTEPDGPAISSMASKLGGNAGFTLLPTPTQIIGPNGVWPEPNPLPGSPSGVIAARFGFGSSGLGQFVRIADSRDPNLQGNLSVAGTAAVGGDLTGRGNIGTSDNVSACLRAAMQTDGQVVSRATNCLVRAFMNPNTATIGVNDAAGNPMVVLDGNTGNITAQGTASLGMAQINTIATAGSACASNALVARDGSGALLSCQYGQWKVQGDSKCVFTTTDLDLIQDDGRCYNSVVSPNSPAGGDWFFLEVYRHVNSANYFTFQRVMGMTGSSAGKIWHRNQQSGVSGAGWSSWLQQAETNVAVSGAPCPTNTELAQTASGASLLCQNGTWVGLVDRMGKFAFQTAWEVAVNSATQGVVVAAPTCYANGVPKVYLTPKGEEQIGYVNRFATGSGPWNVYAQDGAGNPVQAVMIAQTYCYYV